MSSTLKSRGLPVWFTDIFLHLIHSELDKYLLDEEMMHLWLSNRDIWFTGVVDWIMSSSNSCLHETSECHLIWRLNHPGYKVTLNTMTCVLTRTGKDTDTHGKRPREDGSRDCSDATTNWGMPEVPRSWKRQGIFFSRAFRGRKALLTPDFRLLTARENKILCFKPISLWYYVQAALGISGICPIWVIRRICESPLFPENQARHVGCRRE